MSSSQESKPVDPVVEETDAKLKGKAAEVESEEEEEEEEDNEEPAATGDASAATTAGGVDGSGAAGKKKNKKKGKRSKIKSMLTGKPDNPEAQAEADLKKALRGLTDQQMKELMALNPSLAQEVSQASGTADPSAEQTAEMLKKMSLHDIMTGLATAGKNAKDMGAYKFWQTQPVPKFGEEGKTMEEGPLKIQTVDEISKEPSPLVAGFEWVTVDLKSDEEIKEVYELLNGHYVEDDEAMFRFNYSPSILRW
jgi:glycylpeptide N-tetradecanoyltransferase